MMPQEREAILFRASLVEVIRSHPTITQRALAARVGRPRTAIYRHLCRLDELGVVVRRHRRPFEVRTDEA